MPTGTGELTTVALPPRCTRDALGPYYHDSLARAFHAHGLRASLGKEGCKVGSVRVLTGLAYGIRDGSTALTPTARILSAACLVVHLFLDPFPHSRANASLLHYP
jgi:hypothetical protein